MAMDDQQRAQNEARVRALIVWAQAGVAMLATRIFSILALAGGIGLGFYTVWQQNWIGVAVFAVYAVVIFRECVQSEDRGRDAQRNP